MVAEFDNPWWTSALKEPGVSDQIGATSVQLFQRQHGKGSSVELIVDDEALAMVFTTAGNSVRRTIRTLAIPSRSGVACSSSLSSCNTLETSHSEVKVSRPCR